MACKHPKRAITQLLGSPDSLQARSQVFNLTVPSKTHLEAARRGGPFVSKYGLAQQLHVDGTGCISTSWRARLALNIPKLGSLSQWELGEVWPQPKFTCLIPGLGPKYIRINPDLTKQSC